MEKKFAEVKTPEELYEFLVTNMEYGIVDRYGKKWVDCTSEEMNVANMNWQMRSPQEIVKDGVGHCYDYTEVEREWFGRHGYKFKTFWYCAYRTDRPEFGGGPTHACLVFFDKGKWHHFEVSDYGNRGIHEYDTLEEFETAASKRQIEYAKSLEDGEYGIIFREFKKPKKGLSFMEYVHEVAPSI